jgi:hypothetical protein
VAVFTAGLILTFLQIVVPSWTLLVCPRFLSFDSFARRNSVVLFRALWYVMEPQAKKENLDLQQRYKLYALSAEAVAWTCYFKISTRQN